jgi:Leucine-rich repeat (LRR) protein
MRNIFPIYKFKRSDVEYQIITDENKATLSGYMHDNNLKRLIITPGDDKGKGWNHNYLPDLSSFDFIDELLVYWTNIDDIKGVEVCKNLKTLWLDNGDKTYIDFSNFSKLEKFISWDRKGIENIWDVPTLKILTVAGLKKGQFKSGIALDSVQKLRILKTALEDISFLSRARNVFSLELLEMNKIKDLDVLGKLVQLEHLRIEANKVINFYFVKNLVNLKSCYIKSKVAKNIDVGCFLPLMELKDFNISGNEIMQIINAELKNIFN